MFWPHSEIAHAVSSRPDGDFKVVEVLGKGHNPELFRCKDGSWAVYCVNDRKPCQAMLYRAKEIGGPWVCERMQLDLDGKKMLEGQSVDMRDDVEALLNAGLIAQGIYDPTDVNRTRAFAYIEFMPDRPIEGADKMVEFLKASNSAIYNRVLNDFKKKGFKDIKDIDSSDFVRMALDAMSAYKQQ